MPFTPEPGLPEHSLPHTALLPDNWHGLPLATVAALAPVQLLDWPLAAKIGVQVAVKREDLLHPALGGNKFYKLHGHLQRFAASGRPLLVSFGGAWSNHIHALAAASAMLGLNTLAVIRGEKPATPSATLQFAGRCGLRLKFISRSDYRQKHTPAFLSALERELGPFYCVPEGGGDVVGARGCTAWARQALAMAPWVPTHVALACGTGGTLAGVLAAIQPVAAAPLVQGFLAIKGTMEATEAFGREAALKAAQITGLASTVMPAFELKADYSFGGYAKFPAELAAFMSRFVAETGVPLDRVYTAKLFCGLARELEQGAYPPGSRVLVLHTGGLQGNGADTYFGPENHQTERGS